jgi:putative flippase GtrA
MRRTLAAALSRPEVRYLIVGGLNTAFSYGLYSAALILLHALAVPGDYAIAVTFSWLVSNLTSFALQRRFVFGGAGNVVLEFAKFSSVTLGSFFANLAMGTFAVVVLGLDSQIEKLVSQLVITMILVIITYVLHRQFSFRRPSHTEALGSIAVVTGEIPVQAEDAQRTADGDV